ncbi:hypothetical protein IF1G_02843 [Cordyceps javanica]|uniref:Uncharacterized protein n=1 Tax=Cordyceps javanica TaxID=43265 RepID=A0A545VAN1_9HYPO|nr:hypothetical protein IF1G_02843 [Cordyceps javanica]
MQYRDPETSRRLSPPPTQALALSGQARPIFACHYMQAGVISMRSRRTGHARCYITSLVPLFVVQGPYDTRGVAPDYRIVSDVHPPLLASHTCNWQRASHTLPFSDSFLGDGPELVSLAP